MYKQLEKFLEERLDMAKYKVQYKHEKQALFNQAFGAAEFCIRMNPDIEGEVISLWEGYQPEFEKIIYG